MSYFKRLIERANELDTLGRAYLDALPYVSPHKAAARIWAAANRTFEAANNDWDAVPDAVAQILDGGMPFYYPPRKGSLRFVLGFSLVSQEAHLRNLLERLEGRTTEELPFPVVAEEDLDED